MTARCAERVVPSHRRWCHVSQLGHDGMALPFFPWTQVLNELADTPSRFLAWLERSAGQPNSEPGLPEPGGTAAKR